MLGDLEEGDCAVLSHSIKRIGSLGPHQGGDPGGVLCLNDGDQVPLHDGVHRHSPSRGAHGHQVTAGPWTSSSSSSVLADLGHSMPCRWRLLCEVGGRRELGTLSCIFPVPDQAIAELSAKPGSSESSHLRAKI